MYIQLILFGLCIVSMNGKCQMDFLLKGDFKNQVQKMKSV
jgi:hypothetical protein